jgi:hypothetical protein
VQEDQVPEDVLRMLLLGPHVHRRVQLQRLLELPRAQIIHLPCPASHKIQRIRKILRRKRLQLQENSLPKKILRMLQRRSRLREGLQLCGLRELRASLEARIGGDKGDHPLEDDGILH